MASEVELPLHLSMGIRQQIPSARTRGTMQGVTTDVIRVSRQTPRTFYRTVAIAEAVTWTGLLAGMALKYGADIPVAVLIAGSIHGLVFISYALTAALVGVNQHWSTGRIAAAVAAAIVP
jgi:integral membrane protein